jgi:hypothetical protein
MRVCIRLRGWSRAVLASILALAWAAAYGQTSAPVSLGLRRSHNPLSPYSPSEAPPPPLTNSPRLNQLIREGKLYLSL